MIPTSKKMSIDDDVVFMLNPSGNQGCFATRRWRLLSPSKTPSFKSDHNTSYSDSSMDGKIKQLG